MADFVCTHYGQITGNPTIEWNVTDAVPSERYRDGSKSATRAWSGDRCRLMPE